MLTSNLIAKRFDFSSDDYTTEFNYDIEGKLSGYYNNKIIRDPESGLMSEIIYSDKIKETYQYNDYGELTKKQISLSGQLIFEENLGRDQMGKIISKSGFVKSNSYNLSYEFDELGQLTNVNENGTVAKTYEYDLSGNRIRLSASNDLMGEFDAQDRIVSYGNFEFKHSLNNEVSEIKNNRTGEMKKFTYDSFGNIITAMVGSDNIQYILDGKFRRVGKIKNGVVSKRYIYEDNLTPVAEVSESGEIIQLYIYGTNPNTPDMIKVPGVGLYKVVQDHLGSPVLIFDLETGEIVQELELDEFGNVLKDTNPGFQPFGFAGGLYDLDTGLVKFGARDYNSRTGRWMQKDPALFNGRDTNLYRYAFNNPILFNDPDGLKVSQCKRPLAGMSDTYGPLNHTFLCVNGYCNGQTNASGEVTTATFITGEPGAPSNDGTMGSDGSIVGSGAGSSCKEKKPPKNKEKCFDSCVKNRISSSSRPTYAIGPRGTDCQEYAAETVNSCFKSCN